jgi:hypothetical protein
MRHHESAMRISGIRDTNMLGLLRNQIWNMYIVVAIFQFAYTDSSFHAEVVGGVRGALVTFLGS